MSSGASGRAVLSTMLDRLLAGLMAGPNMNCRPHASRQRVDLTQLAKLTFDWAANNGFPILIIALANFGLVLRVIGEKHRRQQVVSWRKQRRMTVQLLSISCLYFFTWFPNLCIGVVQQLFIPGFLLQVQFDYVFDLTYLICLFLPWICLGLFPQLIQWMKTHLLRRPGAPHAVGPSLLLTQHSKRHVASQL